MTPAQNVALLLAAYRQGRIRESRVRHWAQRAAAGEDISVVASFQPQPYTALPAARDVGIVASQLAGVFAGAGMPVSGDEITDAEADALFPARTVQEAEARDRTVQAAAAALRDTPDDDLYRLIFGGGQ